MNESEGYLDPDFEDPADLEIEVRWLREQQEHRDIMAELVTGWAGTVESHLMDIEEEDFPAGERGILARLHGHLCEARDQIAALPPYIGGAA